MLLFQVFGLSLRHVGHMAPFPWLGPPDLRLEQVGARFIYIYMYIFAFPVVYFSRGTFPQG